MNLSKPTPSSPALPSLLPPSSPRLQEIFREVSPASSVSVGGGGGGGDRVGRRGRRRRRGSEGDSAADADGEGRDVRRRRRGGVRSIPSDGGGKVDGWFGGGGVGVFGSVGFALDGVFGLFGRLADDVGVDEGERSVPWASWFVILSVLLLCTFRGLAGRRRRSGKRKREVVVGRGRMRRKGYDDGKEGKGRLRSA